jgi:8-oxo-dGTP pyrophosphatase MutT (NUDIX family)
MAHVHEKIDFTVGVLVVYQDKVLLRLHEKYHIWLDVGGHVELDEDPNQAAIREVKEEVGLDIVLWDGNKKFQEVFTSKYDHRELIPPVAMNRHNISETHEHIDMVYFAKSESDNVIPENADDEWKWLTYAEVDAMEGLLPDIKFYAKLALETLGKK